MALNKKKGELEFKVLYKIQNDVLTLTGAHPFIPKDWKWFPKYFIMQGLVVTQFIAMTHNLIYHSIKERQYQAICADGSANIVFMLISMMYVILIVYQKEFCVLINRVKDDYEVAKTLPQYEYDIMVKYAKKGFMVSKLWTAFVTIGGVSIPAQAFCLTMYSKYYGDQYIYSLYELHFPGLTEGTFIHYFVVDWLYAYAIFHSMMMYDGVIPLGPMFMMHACGQLEILENRMMKLFTDTHFSMEETQNNLRKIIEHLQQIYEFVAIVQQCFKHLYEIILKGAALLIPLLAFTISRSFVHDREISTQCITFFFGALVISIVICTYSNDLLDRGEAFRYSIYDCGWEKYKDLKSRKMLLIMLTRAVRPIAIRTMFRPINLDTLANIFKESYTYFNLLCAVFNK